MTNQMYFIALIASLIGLVLGCVLAYLLTRRSVAAQLLAAQEQGRAGAAVEIATFAERLRANESDRQHIETERQFLVSSLAQIRDEAAKASERALRVPNLVDEVMRLTESTQIGDQKILRLSSEVAEKSQALSDASFRIANYEKNITQTVQELSEARGVGVLLREETARMNAELRAERDASIILRDSVTAEKQIRTTAEESVARLSAQLSDTATEGAVFQSKAARIAPLEEKNRQIEEQLTRSVEQVANLRQQLGQVTAEFKAERDLADTLRLNWEAEKTQREAAVSKNNALSMELAEVSGRLDAERSQAEEKLSLLVEAKEALTNQFKSLANDILEEKSKKFTEQNHTNISQLLDPLRTKIHEFQGKVEEVYVQEGKDRSALGEQVRQLMELNQVLSQDAKNLTTALKGSSKTQGNWGELILERVLEASGLRKGHEYDVQESHTREDGTRAQPDVVIHLPEDRHLIVDAKVSLVAYEAWVSADDDALRQVAAKRHLDSMRLHMKGLSDKNYQALYGLKSLDFVLMFVPIEPAFMLAVTHDQNICMDAYNKNVLLVSPSTLLFVVRTVAHLWRQEAQSKNAQDIAKRGGELYDRLAAFVTDLEKVGERLRQTQDSYNDARNKLYLNKGNVIRQAEMLKQLGAKGTKSFPAAVVDLASEDHDELDPEPITALEFVPD